MDEQKAACAQSCDKTACLLKIAGGFLAVMGLLALIAANKETPILGAGMLPAGLLLLLGSVGGKRGWKGFPAVPVGLAALLLLWAGMNFARHMKRRAQVPRIEVLGAP